MVIKLFAAFSTAVLINWYFVLFNLVEPINSKACFCKVGVTAEYCGSELNLLNNNSDCIANNLYFCGPSNLNKTAVIMKRCNNGSGKCKGPNPQLNPCRRISTLDCHCTSTFNAYSGRGSQCGSSMTGTDCEPNMVYFCESAQVTPLDACTKGCADGQCVV